MVRVGMKVIVPPGIWKYAVCNPDNEAKIIDAHDMECTIVQVDGNATHINLFKAIDGHGHAQGTIMFQTKQVLDWILPDTEMRRILYG